MIVVFQDCQSWYYVAHNEVPAFIKKTKSVPAKKPARPLPAIKRSRGFAPDLHLASWMDGEVRYISEQTFHLVLYVSTDPSRSTPEIPAFRPPRFKTPSKWNLLFHQTAGFACHHRYMYACFLPPRPAIRKLGSLLLSRYNGSLLAQPVTLDTANEYNDLLRSYGLTSNHSFTELEEGFYPIDIECLGKVTSEKFPRDLRAALLKPMPRYHKRNVAALMANWVNFGLAILGPNCD